MWARSDEWCNGSNGPRFIFLTMFEDFYSAVSTSRWQRSHPEMSVTAVMRPELPSGGGTAGDSQRCCIQAATNWSGCWGASWQWSEQFGPVAVSPGPKCTKSRLPIHTLIVFIFYFLKQVKNSSLRLWGSAASAGDTAFPKPGFLAGPRPKPPGITF